MTTHSQQKLAPGERPPAFVREATTGRFNLAAHLGQRPLVLLGAESLCPECGVPEEHWREAVE
jgi:hypothetical protein